ncbi:DNA primase [Carnobacteriaceae bacterium zg-ZUI252]|nr:DNA primase [Carnobacteriaceae bacterium zg-ZUI252]
MVKIPNEQIESIAKSVDIVDVIDQFVSLKKRGKNHFGYCPFHDERTPSFSVSQEKQLFKCFSCGRAGNVFSFFMEKDGLTFAQSVKKVADLAGVPLKIDTDESSLQRTPQQIEQDEIIACHEWALDFYHHVLLHTTEGEEALAYLKDRGLTLETIQTFKIGVSPASRELLVKLLQSKGYSDELIDKTGLVSVFDNRRIDRFYNRIMVPLRDASGRCVAFSGRIYKKTTESDSTDFVEPKYLNSPETHVFQKSQFLFNLDLARGSIRKQEEVVLCEGYMDVIALYQAGLHNSVASMGTSLTQQQLGMMQRIARHITLAYDGDSAGLKATDRAIRLIRDYRHFEVSVIPMIDNLDPDEMIQRYGNTYFLNHVLHEKETIFKFYERYYRHEFRLDNQKGQLDYIDALLKELTFESSITARALAISEIAKSFHMDEKVLQQQYEVIAKNQPKRVSNEAVAPFGRSVSYDVPKVNADLDEITIAERHLLRRVLQDVHALSFIDVVDSAFTFENSQLGELYRHYRAFLQHQQGTLTEFMHQLEELPQQQLASELMLSFDDAPVTQREIVEVMQTRNRALVKQELGRIQHDINEATKAGDTEKVQQLLFVYQNLLKQ